MSNVIRFPAKGEYQENGFKDTCPAMDANPFLGEYEDVRYRTFCRWAACHFTDYGIAPDDDATCRLYDLSCADATEDATRLLQTIGRTVDDFTEDDAYQVAGMLATEAQFLNEDRWRAFIAAGQDKKRSTAFFERAEPIWRAFELSDTMKWEVYLLLCHNEHIIAIFRLHESMPDNSGLDLKAAKTTIETLETILEEPK